MYYMNKDESPDVSDDENLLPPKKDSGNEQSIAQKPDVAASSDDLSSEVKRTLLGLTSAEIGPQPLAMPNEDIEPYDGEPDADDEETDHLGGADSIRNQETIMIDPPMRDIGSAWMDNPEGRSNFSMPISDGRDVEIEVERFVSIGNDGGEFIGTVKGLPGSSVRLSYRGNAEAGTISIPSENKVFRFYPASNGSIVLQERDLAAEEAATIAPPLNVELPPVPNFIPPPPPTDLVESMPDTIE